MHQRKVIRDAVVNLLKAGNTAVGNNVFPSRFLPLEKEVLPCINVYTKSEQATVWQVAPEQLERKLALVIEINVRAVDGLDDTLDAIAEQVENVLMQDDTLDDVCGDCSYVGAEITISENGDAPIGSCVLNYEVYYYTYTVADETVENGFGPLESIDATWRQPTTPEDQDDAEDIIDLPQPP